MLSRVLLYDPVVDKTVCVRLWEEKADINFRMNGLVYLLRGIEIREFKGVREYHTSKDFNYRVLTFSYIEQSMKGLYEQRWKKLRHLPERVESRNVQECLLFLQK